MEQQKNRWWRVGEQYCNLQVLGGGSSILVFLGEQIEAVNCGGSFKISDCVHGRKKEEQVIGVGWITVME
jgi:hypothetical protein